MMSYKTAYRMLYKYVKKEVVIPKKAPLVDPFVKKSNFKATFLAIFFFFIGFSMLGYSFYPYISHYISRLDGSSNIDKMLLSPSVSDRYPTKKVISDNISSNYLVNINRNISSTNKALDINPRTFPEYANITGTMKISIPKLKYKNIPVTINVNSFEENQYLPFLETALAHFKGTSLPDKPGNTFIYGHSSNILFAKAHPNDPKVVFSFLDELTVGDEIEIEYEGKIYSYSVQKIKTVSPEDISPIYSYSDDKILTLMTCWSPGIGTERLIVNAKLTSEKEV